MKKGTIKFIIYLIVINAIFIYAITNLLKK